MPLNQKGFETTTLFYGSGFAEVPKFLESRGSTLYFALAGSSRPMKKAQ
jgi:hypothetical protein